MVNNRGERATANLRMLEFVARKLGPLNDEVVYLGGCSTALFITDINEGPATEQRLKIVMDRIKKIAGK